MSDLRVLWPGLLLGLLLGCQLNDGGLGGSGGSNTNGVGSGPDPSTTAPSTIPPVPTATDPDGSGGSTGPSSEPTTTDTSSGSTDATDSDSSSTGEPEPWPAGPFGVVVPVESLNTVDFNEDDPSLTSDLLEIVFASNRGGKSEDIYVATRDSALDDWDMPVRIDEISTGGFDNTPQISRDGLILMMARANDTTMAMGQDLFISYRTARDQPWSDPTPVVELNTIELDIGPAFAVELEEVYWCSRRMDGVGDTDIWMADLQRVGSQLEFGPPQLVPGINTTDGECSMSPSPDRLVMIYDSPREIEGSQRIWESTRASVEEPFDYGIVHDEIWDPAGVDIDPWISDDGHLLYFSSNREGSQDLFWTER